MSRFAKLKFAVVALALGAVAHAQPALACAACFGKSDSPLANGMNWGIFSLLAVVVCVLGSVAAFFIFLARKAASVAASTPPGELTASNSKA